MISSSDWILNDRLQDLLAEWIERRDTDDEMSVQVLCGNDPGLIEPLTAAIERLSQTDWMFDTTPQADSPDDTSRLDDWQAAILAAEAVDAGELLDRVEAVRILSDQKLSNIRAALLTNAGREAAKLLLDSGPITAYQLRYLCEDRGRLLELDDYLLLEPIGEGGMGRVYKALQRNMDRVVAVKVLSPKTFSSEQAIKRFRREVKTAALLNHPNIVSAFDAGEDGGRRYLVMEYIDGCDLSTLVRRDGPLDVGRAVDCILQAARALQYAHEQQVVHRDVKPSNLLIDSAGTVKMLDLGLARIGSRAAADPVSPDPELTASGQVMGTVDYLAPEQALDSRQADERSDVYSLGCTLYNLLHARPVYDGESVVNRVLAHQSAEIPSLAAGRDDVSDALNAVFSMMVAKEPENRYQTMAEVLAGLQAVSSGEQVAPAPKAVRSADRRKRLWLSVAGLAVFALLVAIRPALQQKHGETRRTESPTKRDIGNSAQRPPPAIVPFTSKQARKHQAAWATHLGVPVEYENSIGMRFRLIPPGEFVMGTSKAELDELLKVRGPGYWRSMVQSEFGPHRVCITRPFYLGLHEVTQREYREVTGGTPSQHSPTGAQSELIENVWSEEFPVENVSWFDAVQFCDSLSRRAGLAPAYRVLGVDVSETEAAGYRLPSEAQWEFACRSGTAATYCFGDDAALLSQSAWYGENAQRRTHAVGQRLANAFGLRDMHGNVFEWCWDRFGGYGTRVLTNPVGAVQGERRVQRGGSWEEPAMLTRSATRAAKLPSDRNYHVGFRIVLPIQAATGVSKPPEPEQLIGQ